MDINYKKYLKYKNKYINFQNKKMYGGMNVGDYTTGCDLDLPGNVCSICFNQFLDNQICCITQCRHLYHYNCLYPWTIEHTTCPFCRTRITDVTIIKILQRRLIIPEIINNGGTGYEIIKNTLSIYRYKRLPERSENLVRDVSSSVVRLVESSISLVPSVVRPIQNLYHRRGFTSPYIYEDMSFRDFKSLIRDIFIYSNSNIEIQEDIIKEFIYRICSDRDYTHRLSITQTEKLSNNTILLIFNNIRLYSTVIEIINIEVDLNMIISNKNLFIEYIHSFMLVQPTSYLELNDRINEHIESRKNLQIIRQQLISTITPIIINFEQVADSIHQLTDRELYNYIHSRVSIESIMNTYIYHSYYYNMKTPFNIFDFNNNQIFWILKSIYKYANFIEKIKNFTENDISNLRYDQKDNIKHYINALINIKFISDPTTYMEYRKTREYQNFLKSRSRVIVSLNLYEPIGILAHIPEPIGILAPIPEPIGILAPIPDSRNNILYNINEIPNNLLILELTNRNLLNNELQNILENYNITMTRLSNFNNDVLITEFRRRFDLSSN